MAKTRLKAWVRYSSAGTLIPSTLIIRKSRPSGSGWLEIPYERCCSSIEVVPIEP